jgi:large subunit ribosomal protein L32
MPGLVGQSRTSKSRRGMRRSHLALKAPTTTVCKKCGKPILPHRVCKYCGYYKGKKVVTV